MHFFFDESGDFAFGAGRFDCYVHAALIAPDELLVAIREFVEGRKMAWRVDELHATTLSQAQLLDVAAFVAGSGAQLLAFVTDTDLTTIEDIQQFRLDQAGTLARNLDWYREESTKARGAPVPEIEAWMKRNLARAGLPSRISHSEFLQAHFLIRLVHASLQKSLLAFFEDRWRLDPWTFTFLIDRKIPNKLAAGEKYLSDAVVPVLGSGNAGPLAVPESWKEAPLHPFVSRYSRERGRIFGRDVEGVIDISGIFERGLTFGDSRDEPGLQLADVVAHVVRDAVLKPGDKSTQVVFDTLRPRLLNDEGGALTIHRLASGQVDQESKDRYRPLYWPAR